MASVAIVTDSTADIPFDLMELHNIHMVPLSVRIGAEVYQDRVTITPTEFMRKLVAADEFPTTSQPSVGRFLQLYNDLAERFDGIVSIHISSRLSGTYQNALLARDMIDGRIPIAVIDSRSASMGLGFQALAAARLAQQGAGIEEIERAIQGSLNQSHVLFLVDTLEYLRRGGRIGRAAEIVGSVLQLKPILRVEEGVVVPLARTRTRARAVSGLVELVTEFPRIGQVSILSTADAADVAQLAEAMERLYPKQQTIYTQMSPVLSAHIGPGGMGIAIYEGDPFDLTGGDE